MQADFLDAHNRHWKDAEALFAKQRWANADHLYGVTAECGLKRLMQAFGMQLNAAGDGPDKSALSRSVWLTVTPRVAGRRRSMGSLADA